MDSFLITGPIQKAKEYTFEFLKKERVDKFDITIIESEKAVGISQIREFQKKIYLKPYKSDKKAVTLVAEEGITIEAQNALLKVLEEPPSNTLIIILGKNNNDFLPTIISRCKLINIKEEGNKTDLSKYEKLLVSLNNKKIGEKLKIAQDYSKDRQIALEFLKSMLLVSQKLLEEMPKKSSVKKINAFNKAYGEVNSTNINLRLLLENLLLSI